MNIAIISKPNVNFTLLLTATESMIGRSPANRVDKHKLPLTDSEKFLSILACLSDQDAPVQLHDHLLNHVSVSVLTLAPEETVGQLLTACDMKQFVFDTIKRGVSGIILTGTLQQWQRAGERVKEFKPVFISEGIDLWKQSKRIH